MTSSYAFAEPVMPGPRLGELSALLQVARGGRPSRTPVRLLLHGQVPHEPGMRAVVSQRCFLGDIRCQAITGHSNTISSNTDILEEVKRRVLPGLNARVSTPRSR